MHRYSANYIFPVNRPPIKNGIVVLNDDNTIVEIIDPEGSIKEYASTEFHNGIIVPGFVNAHCHLELSHLKGRIAKSGGIAQFVSSIQAFRKADPLDIAQGVSQAFMDLKTNGTIAVGDICNSSDTINDKAKSKILFHNFIEIFGLNAFDAKDRFRASLELREKFKSNGCYSSSVTPHATYSISESLWRLLADELAQENAPVSIHYGESKQEYSLVKDHSGPLAESFKEAGIPLEIPLYSRLIEIVKAYIPKGSKVLFVHNTFASGDEIKELSSHFKETYFVLCPSSNLFIEGVLPDVPTFVNAGVNLALGTDSYASTDSISVFDQIMILLGRYPVLSFNEVIGWATMNGAKALSFDNSVGSLEAGKQPGLNLISDFDFASMRPTAKSKVKRLV